MSTHVNDPSPSSSSSPPGATVGRAHVASPRSIATGRAGRRIKQYPDFDLSPLDTTGLSARDAALARAIDHAVARRWLTLEAVVRTCVSREWTTVQAPIRGVLLVGAAQMLLLDRLPDHAVINDAVNWTKQRVRPGAGGLVNAVLRKIASLRAERVDSVNHEDDLDPDLMPLADGGAWRLKRAVFDADPRRRLAQQTSVPLGLLDRWRTVFDATEARRLAHHALVVAPVIITGWPDGTPLPDGVIPHTEPGFLVVDTEQTRLAEILETHPSVRVQDPGTANALGLSTQIQPGCIVDFCAGNGTKTHQLADLHPQARIIATDPDDTRRGVLRQAFKGHDRVLVVEPRDLAEHNGSADLVVLDVPCSNTGVLARRVEARHRFDTEHLGKLVDLQRQIMANAIPMLADDGHLQLITCSIEPGENEGQVEWLTRWHPFQTVATQSSVPQGGPGASPTTYADGGFAALFRREGQATG